MISRVRKWLGSRIEISLRWGDLLAIVLVVTVVNIFWPGVPTWAFAVFGALLAVADRAGAWTGRWLVRWLRRRRTA